MTKIVSIHSFRGGTGKSNLTANLAAQLAMQGKRVAVFDTDIQSPGIHVPFGLTAETMPHTLNEYLRAECEIEDAAYSIGEHPGTSAGRARLAGKTLWLVPSDINGGEISRILKDGYDVGRLNEGMQTLRKRLNLDYMLIDTHPGLNEETLLSVAISDVLIIILRPDQQDFQGTGVTVDIAKDLDVPSLNLVINKVLPKVDFAHLRQTVEGMYDTPVAAVMPLTEDLVELASEDIFSLCMPDHPWSRAVQSVVDVIMQA